MEWVSKLFIALKVSTLSVDEGRATLNVLSGSAKIIILLTVIVQVHDKCVI